MRSAFDKLLAWFGVAITVALLVAGGLLTWASSFVGDQVYDQLSQQDITMPGGPALEDLPPEDKAALEPYAGQPMTTGPQAKAYADHYILAHMNAGGAELAEEVAAMGVDTSTWKQPITYQSAGAITREIAADESLSEDVKTEATAAVSEFRNETLFKGSTLRGLLLYGYAFATMGTIAGYAAIACWVGAAIFLVLTVLGFWHAGRAAKEEKAALGGGSVPPPATGSGSVPLTTTT